MEGTDAARANPERAQKIIDGARAVFVEHGFDGASVDDIAAQAGVSKATLYRYFPDKRQLFRAFVAAECENQARQTFVVDAGEASTEAVLRQIAQHFTRFVLSDVAVEMFRVAFADVRRFPEIGRDFYDSGPGLAHKRLAQLLKAGHARGELVVPNPDFAAEQFTELCKAGLHIKRLMGVDAGVNEAEIDRVASGAVDVFMRAYGAGA